MTTAVTTTLTTALGNHPVRGASWPVASVRG